MQEGQEPTARFTMPAGLDELARELERDWPAMQAALRASGVPLNDEETDEEKAARETAEAEAAAETAAAEAKKPWGDDKDFDPEKAWTLIQNVRGDVEKLKKERDSLEKQVKEHTDASKSDQEKLEERAKTAEEKLSATERSLLLLEVASEKGLSSGQAKRLVGDTKEELEADAEELLKSFKDDDDAGGGSRRTPKPRLKSGASATTEPDETDPDKLAEQVPRT
jgi:hypothetical protein